jgi:ribosomal protein S18 acetylase RimI-like enzyme
MTACSLRPISSADLEFLHQVYVSTREAELCQVDWSAAQKEAFTRMQFNAQHAYYSANYLNPSLQIVECEGVPAGRLYLDRRADEIRIVDIALLPRFRGQGLGTELLAQVLAEGQSRGLPVTIHVEVSNPALRLYERLGFRQVQDEGIYYFMRWLPES